MQSLSLSICSISEAIWINRKRQSLTFSLVFPCSLQGVLHWIWISNEPRRQDETHTASQTKAQNALWMYAARQQGELEELEQELVMLAAVSIQRSDPRTIRSNIDRTVPALPM